MYLIDPMVGFYVTSGYILMQVSFAVQALYFLLSLNEIDSDIRRSLWIVVTFFGICFTTQAIKYLIQNSKHKAAPLANQVLHFVYIFASTAGIYYVITQQDELFISLGKLYWDALNLYGSERAVQMGIEMAFSYYYFTFLIVNYFGAIFFTILFLLLSTFCSIKRKVYKKSAVLEPIMAPDSDGKQKGTQNVEDTFSETEGDEYLLHTLTILQNYFFKYGITCLLSAIAYINSDESIDYTWEYKDPLYLTQSVLLGVLFLYHIVDHFSNIKFGKICGSIRVILLGVLYYVSGQTFADSITDSGNQTYGSSWAQQYFFIMTVDILLNLVKYYTSRKVGVQFKIFEGFEEYEKVAIPILQDRDVTMSNDIFCVSYLSYFYLQKKELLGTEEKDKVGTYSPEIQEKALEQEKQDHQDLEDRVVTINDDIATQNFGKSLMIFCVQILMVYFVMMTFNDSTDSGFTAASTLEILVIRFLCAIFLHIQLFDEVCQGITMFYYAISQIGEKQNRNAMIMLSLMKILSSLFAEICNIMLISTEDITLDIIKDFVALTIIAELDSLYCKTIKRSSVKDRVSGKVLYFDLDKEKKTKQQGQGLWLWVYKLLHKFHVSCFFYFMPFIVPILSYSLLVQEKGFSINVMQNKIWDEFQAQNSTANPTVIY